MFSSNTLGRKFRLGAGAIAAGIALAVTPALAGAAQADTTPLYLYTTWDLYDYQLGGNVPLFSQNDGIQAAAQKLATQEGNCAGKTCLYLPPSLPGSPTTSIWFSAKVAYRVTDEQTIAAVVAQALEQPGGSTLRNAYYNYGGVGTYTVGNQIYAVLIMAHYNSDPGSPRV